MALKPLPPQKRAGSVAKRLGLTGIRNQLKLIILVVISIVFGYLYFGGSYSWYNIVKLRKHKEQLHSEIKKIESQKRNLTKELELLEGDSENDERTRFKLERLAREKHGMAREDELIYRFTAEHGDTTKIKPSDGGP